MLKNSENSTNLDIVKLENQTYDNNNDLIEKQRRLGLKTSLQNEKITALYNQESNCSLKNIRGSMQNPEAYNLST